MSDLSSLAITGIMFGSLVGGIIIYELSSSKSKKKTQFPNFNNNDLKEAKETLSSFVPVSRSDIVSAIQDTHFLKINGGTKRRYKKNGKRKSQTKR
jgi:hypothetical protein